MSNNSDEENDADQQPATQKARTEELWSDRVSRSILESKDTWAQAYKTAKPYAHGVLPDLFEADFLRDVLHEVKTNSQVNFKESDLFRVYQSIDLGNVKVDDASNQEKLPQTLRLRRILYSQEWRQFVEDLAGLPRNTLTEQVDCAFNCHTQGCHLLCHDDVIGTRKISYIIYLTEGDWTQDQGGSLELYDSTRRTAADSSEAIHPTCTPSQTVLPNFNHMAFFEVKPGVSFHAVQEVLGDRPRLSLQGWYHAKDAPAEAESATLSQLKKTPGESNASSTYTRFATNATSSIPENDGEESNQLSMESLKYLSTYIDPVYLTEDSLKSIQKTFEHNSSIQLRSFLNNEWAGKLSQATASENSHPNQYDHGVSGDWKLVGPAHKQRFLQYSGPTAGEGSDSTEAGAILAQLQQMLFQSDQFAEYIHALTSLKATGHVGQVRRFRPGLDYTVAHYGLLQPQSVLDATLCFVAGTGADIAETDDPPEADVAWQSGDVGGYECYIEAEDDDDENGNGSGAADEYNQEDDTELLSVSASNNTLSLVYRDPGTMRFVKYVGSQAPSSRYDVAMEYECECDDDKDGDVREGEDTDKDKTVVEGA